jgi:hypothetical protein
MRTTDERPTGNMIRRVPPALVAGLLAIGLLATPAAASVSTADPAGDGVGPGDVRAVRLSYPDAPFVGIRIRTAAPIDLDTSPAWHRATSTSILRANLDTDDDPAVDYVAVMEPAPGGPVALTLRDFNGPMTPMPRIQCLTVVQPQPTIIEFRANRNCMDGADHVRAFVRYRLDRGGEGTVDSDDRAPNHGFTPVFQIVV